MKTFAQNISWNRQETALLIDAYLRIKAGELKKRTAVLNLSARLRNRMIHNGIEINEKYRNESGIMLQMSTIDYCFTSGEHGLKPSNSLFPELCELYLSHREEFNAILLQAERMYPTSAAESHEKKAPFSDLPKHNYRDEKTTEDPVVEEAPMETYQSHNMLDEIKAILGQYFVNGYRLNSMIEFKRFIRFYQDKFNKSCSLTADQFSQMVKSCGISCNGKVFIPEQLLPITLRDEIKSHVESELSQGKRCVYYEVLFNDFKDKLLETLIPDRETLHTCLHFFFGDMWHFSDEGITLTDGIEVDIDQEVVKYIKELGRVVTEDEVISGLGHLPSDGVRLAFSRNKDELIIGGRKQRFHINLFVISNEELKVVKSLIDNAIDQYRFMTSDELFNDIRLNIPELLSNNSSIPDTGIRNALASSLGHKYAFNGPIISANYDDITAGDAIQHFAFKKRDFSLKEVDAFASQLNVMITSYLNMLLDYSIRVDEKTFVHVDKVRFNIVETDVAISKFIDKKGYLPIKDIYSFAGFPECGFPWNHRLLESFLLSRSKKYSLLYNHFLNKNCVSGAIVEKYNTKLQSFNDVLSFALADSGIPLTTNDALEFFVQKGYITRRRYAQIELVLARAKQIRNN